MNKLKALIVMAVALLPASRRKNGLLNRLGHEIHPTARIAPILLLRVRKLRVGAKTSIGFGNTLRSLRLAEFGEEVEVGPRNDIRANPSYVKTAGQPEFAGVFQVGDVVFISKRHVIDCSGGVTIGSWSGLAGRQIFIYSHSYDPQTNTTWAAPTRIGSYSLVASKTILGRGAVLPDASILAMGGVLMPGAKKTHSLYGGVPAKALGVDISEWEFLRREQMSPRNPKGKGRATSPALGGLPAATD